MREVGRARVQCLGPGHKASRCCDYGRLTPRRPSVVGAALAICPRFPTARRSCGLSCRDCAVSRRVGVAVAAWRRSAF
eukprot:3673587-Alexandrium_andersonii.AAC.1